MAVSIKEYVTPGHKRYVHPDALPSPVNPMTATTTTPRHHRRGCNLCTTLRHEQRKHISGEPAKLESLETASLSHSLKRMVDGARMRLLSLVATTPLVVLRRVPRIPIAAYVSLVAIVSPASSVVLPRW
jgi:hypothetical protein